MLIAGGVVKPNVTTVPYIKSGHKKAPYAVRATYEAIEEIAKRGDSIHVRTFWRKHLWLSSGCVSDTTNYSLGKSGLL